jgi:predicted MPP superfamily phosphohydrolase
MLIAVVLSVVLHAYIALRLLPDLGLGAVGFGFVLAYLIGSSLLTPAPLLLRLSRLPERAASALAWTGYLAMGVFSTLFVLCLLRDLTLALLYAFEHLRPGSLSLAHVRRASALIVAAISFMVSAIGVINARRVAKVVQVDLPIPGLPAALSGFTIVQISDIHVGPTIRSGYVDAIVRRVNELDADLVAITGDVIDGSVDRLREHVAPLGKLRARYGTYCVTGNHEYYHGSEAWIAEWRRLGLHVLLNENVVLRHNNERLLIGGVTDYSAHHYHDSQRSDPAAAASCSEPVAVKLLLAHQPRSAIAASEAGFHAQLSGHTHGGQFLPWNFFVRLQQPVVSGLERFHNLWLYVSPGTGYWGPPLRFFAPSEITRLRLVPENSVVERSLPHAAE